MPEQRQIIHVDMDEFFAAVEKLDRPELRGKCLLVGGSAQHRGVVATASYEARQFGCHSAMPMAMAVRLCPHAIVIPVRGDRYAELSQLIFAIFDRFTPLVEPLSIDEAFLDVTGCRRLLGEGPQIAAAVKKAVRDETGLTASLGVAPNKFLAKLASDMDKPDGLTVIRPQDIDRVLPPLPVRRLWGIGQVTAEKLGKIGVRTIGDLRGQSMAWLERQFGSEAQRYFDLARGIDTRPVVPDGEAKSIGHEQTFEVNVADGDEVRRVLLDQVEQVARRLRKSGLYSRGISLKIRYGDFQTISRSQTFESPTDATAELWQAARGLFDHWPFEPVRLIGVAAERLSKAQGQMPLFADQGKELQKKLDSVTDRINDKYGSRTIRRGGTP